MVGIFSELAILRERKLPAVLATIIATQGSVYRKEGARCLIHPDGRITGVISGGCVATDLHDYALRALEAVVAAIREQAAHPGCVIV